MKLDGKLFKFQEDWSKIIHFKHNQFLISGGSCEITLPNMPRHVRAQIFSKKTFIVDTSLGWVKRLPSMKYARQAHGMLVVDNYIYCCAGLHNSYTVLANCERFNLDTWKWT